MHHPQLDNLVEEIRGCQERCYAKEYQDDFAVLNECGPLIDTVQPSKSILFISQAPSRQAMRDGVLSEHKNEFFTNTLLKRLFAYESEMELDRIIRAWQEKVFWIHTANCYPGRTDNGRNDKSPNLQCSKRFMGRFINSFEPRLIILMSGAATKIFSRSLKESLSLKNCASYPSLKDILRAQREFHSKNEKDFQLYKMDGKNRETVACPSLVISHLASYPATEDEKYAVEFLTQRLRKEFGLS